MRQGTGFAADLVHLAVQIQRVGNDTAATGRGEVLDQSFGEQRIENRLKLGESLNGFHAGGAAAKLANSLSATQEQLCHDR